MTRLQKLLALSAFTFIATVGIALFLTKLESEKQQFERFSIEPTRDLSFPEGLLTTTGLPLTRSVFENKWTLLTFGFTHCPDVCPTNIAFMTQEAKKLKPDLRPQLVFVAVDTARDTPTAIRQFLQAFSADVIGVSGNTAAIEHLARQFGAHVMIGKNPEGESQVTHSPHIFVINPTGAWTGLLSAPFAQGDLSRYVTALDKNLKQKLF